MLRAAIWDMDGTLVDTAEQHFRAWADVCRAASAGSDLRCRRGRPRRERIRFD